MTEQTIPEPVAAFIEAVNRHDESAFLDAFTEGGAVDDWGRVFTGPLEVRLRHRRRPAHQDDHSRGLTRL